MPLSKDVYRRRLLRMRQQNSDKGMTPGIPDKEGVRSPGIRPGGGIPQKEGTRSPGIQKKFLPYTGERRSFPVKPRTPNVGKTLPRTPPNINNPGKTLPRNPPRTPPIYNNPNSKQNQLRNLQNAVNKRLPERNQ
jgi:hypothetical protein